MTTFLRLFGKRRPLQELFSHQHLLPFPVACPMVALELVVKLPGPVTKALVKAFCSALHTSLAV